MRDGKRQRWTQRGQRAQGRRAQGRGGDGEKMDTEEDPSRAPALTPVTHIDPGCCFSLKEKKTKWYLYHNENKMGPNTMVKLVAST